MCFGIELKWVEQRNGPKIMNGYECESIWVFECIAIDEMCIFSLHTPYSICLQVNPSVVHANMYVYVYIEYYKNRRIEKRREGKKRATYKHWNSQNDP